MVATKFQLRRRMALRRKLQTLRSLTKSKSDKKGNIIMDAIAYISKLRFQVESVKQDYHCLTNHIQEVKVEKLGTGYLRVRITCKEGEVLMVPILQAFEEMNLNVVEVRSTCKHFFGVEAIVQTNIDATVWSEAILKVIQNHTGKAD